MSTPVGRRRSLSRVGNLISAARVDSCHQNEPLSSGILQIGHDHRHGSNDPANSQRQPPCPLTLCITYVMQAGFLDRITLTGIAELCTIPRNQDLVASTPRVRQDLAVFLAFQDKPCTCATS